MRFRCRASVGGPHPYHASDRGEGREEPARGCSRPHLGSWYGRPYTSSIIRETDRCCPASMRRQAAGAVRVRRRGSTYYKYRNRDIAATWEGDTDQPGVEIAETISNTLMDAYMKPLRRWSFRTLHRLHRVHQHGGAEGARAAHAAVEIVKNETKVPDPDEEAPATADVAPLYTFEPSLEKVLDAILPKYIQSRIHECLLTAAASETASRQNAMHTATDNARNLIDDLTRKLNASRQPRSPRNLPKSSAALTR